MNRVLVAAVLVLAPVAPASAQQPTIQQQFEAASTALDAEQWAEALRLFEALEARITQSPRTLAVIRVRKATALARLGRRDEAIAALRLGLPGLPADDRSLDADRFVALLGLGEAAELSLDYAEARRHYRAAKAVPLDDRLRLGVYRGLVQTEMFDEAATALADADEALALAQAANLGPQNEGLLRTMRGRVLLNMGRHSEALDELRRAKDRLGGLTTRVDLADIVARSDLGIAAMLAGRREEARRALAYAGAGYQQTGFHPGGRMEPPPCGNGLEPGDVAVVEFSIRDDGSVGRATPIYSSRQGAVAIAFANAARRWSWSPESIAEVSPLFRSALRVELRCTIRDPEPESSFGRDQPELTAWLDSRGVPPIGGDGQAPPSPTRLREELARRDAAPSARSASSLPALIQLAWHPGVGAVETAEYLRRAIPIAATEQAPPAVIGDLAVTLAYTSHRANRGRSDWRDSVDFGPVLAMPAVRDDPVATAMVKLAWARSLYLRNDDEDAARILGEFHDAPRAAGDDRIRVDALALEAAIAAARGDMPAAREAYQAMGADARPCAVPRRTRRSGASTADFPQEAQSWGFEGWVNVDARAVPNGEIEQQRTVISYPPFVFNEAAEQVVSRMRLEPVYLPDGATCPAHRQLVQFRLEGF